MASPSYNNMETFGEDHINNYFINKIKDTIVNYNYNSRVLQQRIDKIKEEYDEIIDENEGGIKHKSWEKTDMFNDLIEKAKEELDRENVPLRNNPPYNPFDSDDFRGGKQSKNKRSKNKQSKYKRTKNKRTKNKRTKNKRTKNKRSNTNDKRKKFTTRKMRRN
jgi:hypothetical protein